jgi:uncharacterized membrane protein YbhN (UPF0104 family)
MSRRTRQILLLVASIGVSVVFLVLSLRNVPLADVAAAIRAADLGWIALSFAFATGALLTRGMRWRRLLDDRIGLRPAFLIFSITMLLNQLPLRLGEVARVLLATRRGVPLATAAASVLLERLIDTALVVIALSLALPSVPNIPPTVTATTSLFGLGAGVGLGVLLVFARRPGYMTRVLDFIERRLPPLWRLLSRLNPRQLAADLAVGLHGLATLRGLATLLVWTLIAWGCSFATFYCMTRALDIGGVDLWLSTVLGVTLATFTVAIPVSVASVGPFQGAIRLAGDLIGMAAVDSAALGILVHSMTVLSYAVWGVTGVLSMGVSLADMTRTTEKS